MKGLRPGWAVKAILVVIFTSMFFRCVSAGPAAAATNNNHSVGGASGWDLSSNLQAWAARATFRVGDSLVFRYTPVHDVLEVMKMDYDLCHTIDPMETHNDGETVIPLRQTGDRYFICGRLDHCAIGLKLHVLVLPALQMSPNVNATSPSSPLITSPPSNTANSISNNSSRHGPDGQAVGNDHVLPSPPPSTSNYSINSTDGSPPDHATGDSTTSDGHLTWGSTWIQPLVTVVAALVIMQLMFTSSSIPWWSATSIAVCVLFTRAALFLLVTVVAAELLVIIHAVVFLFIIGTIVAHLLH
ncbi:early nodulin-like protein 2 [Pyrus ussuriensis x Pyrus communis]|uniref:Early nodulin-like protein 2 n=1 Tax=Pyrus ussuriensis x Pyrus communis TaxID=2448454 RepID=A0A5N5I0R8_9ROSA|nr:early nodulin-like protein 2 [Pyrus ussuriensis x Pyrus communis]